MEKKHKRSEEEIANEPELPERKSNISKNTEHDGEEEEDATTSKNRSGQCSADTKPNVGECSASLDRQQHEMNDETKSKIAFDQNPSPDIFKLHAIVCFELFEYLSLEDIHSMGQTCKRFNRIAGNYFQDNYSAAKIVFRNGEIHCNNIPISGFSEYVQNISIDVKELEQFKYVEANCKSLKTIEFGGIWSKIDDDRIECIKKTLAKIGKVTIFIYGFDNFHEGILKYCSNIKSINIGSNGSIDTSWLHQKYPTLEHLSIRGIMNRNQIEDLKILFEKNPNIRSFRCRADFLVENEGWLLATKATLDYLHIVYSGGINTNRVCSVVKRFYERGFYKKLSLFFFILKQNVIEEMCKLPAIERLIRHPKIKNVDFPVMTDVKELNWFCNDINVEPIMNFKFPNVKRIEFDELKLNQLLVLIGRLNKLKEVHIKRYNDENKLLNLWALNKEREKLTGAGKVSIYVDEEIFVASKWAYNNRDSDLIELKRYDSWPHDIFDII